MRWAPAAVSSRSCWRSLSCSSAWQCHPGSDPPRPDPGHHHRDGHLGAHREPGRHLHRHRHRPEHRTPADPAGRRLLAARAATAGNSRNPASERGHRPAGDIHASHPIEPPQLNFNPPASPRITVGYALWSSRTPGAGTAVLRNGPVSARSSIRCGSSGDVAKSNGGRALTQQQAAAFLLSPSPAHDMPTRRNKRQEMAIDAAVLRLGHRVPPPSATA